MKSEKTMKPFCPSNPLGLIVEEAYRKYPVRRAIEQHLLWMRVFCVALPILAGLFYFVEHVPPGDLSTKVGLGIPVLVLVSVLLLWALVNEIRTVDADDKTLLMIASDPGISAEDKASYANHLISLHELSLPSLRRWSWNIAEQQVKRESPGRQMLASYAK
jgi:hypothetical protein